MSHVSDHSLTWSRFQLRPKCGVGKGKKKIEIRDMKTFDETAFQHTLEYQNWAQIYYCGGNINECYELWEENVTRAMDLHMPKKTIILR